ncbi:putative dehydrogenase [Pedobacter sp. CG_S7]|uniref:Gfo/Idh/MocA family protein n=1 Tax=Pedobacter sp. CG_S7 TaxID=3143930 RepID=UPI00339B15D1
MKDNRRNFLKWTGIAGLTLTGGSIFKGFAAEPDPKAANDFKGTNHVQHFNMCGYAAPKLDTVRVGFIGLGQRGPGHVSNLSKLEGVEITGLCDVRPEMVNKVKKSLAGTNHKPKLYTDSKDSWKKLCENKEIDLIYISTPWDLHVSMALYAMEQGKHVAIEVPAAVKVEECWQLVEASERTRKHCMMLENCCYDFFELLTFNMARQGFFGEIVHAEGAYLHDLINLNFQKDGYYEMWRLKENYRNGNLYPTHGLGPVCQVMDINRGDKLDYLVSMSGKDFLMGERAKELAAKDDFFKPFENQTYRGNMNTTTIRTTKGRTIMLQHDVSSPNVYSRIHKISGTKGSALKYPQPGRIATSEKESWLTNEEMKAIEIKYQPAIVKKIGEIAKEAGGHGGMDFLMNWRLIDCLRNGLPLDQDVYDAALWSAIAPLSEQSVANRSNSVDIPDFTNGSWKANIPVDLLLEKGGTTKVKLK